MTATARSYSAADLVSKLLGASARAARGHSMTPIIYRYVLSYGISMHMRMICLCLHLGTATALGWPVKQYGIVGGCGAATISSVLATVPYTRYIYWNSLLGSPGTGAATGQDLRIDL